MSEHFSSEFGREKVGPTLWEGDWDPSNAKELFNYIIQSGNEDLFFGFELGNEVWGLITGDAHFLPQQDRVCNYNIFIFL